MGHRWLIVVYLKPVSSGCFGCFLSETVKDKKPLCPRSRADSPSRRSCLGFSAAHGFPPCEGSPARERALPSDQGERLLLVSSDFFLHNAEVQVQTCRCIPAKSFDTFTSVLSRQRRTPYLPPTQTPPPLTPQEPAVTVGWGPVPEQEPLRTVKNLKVSKSAERMWGGGGGGGGGGVGVLIIDLLYCRSKVQQADQAAHMSHFK